MKGQFHFQNMWLQFGINVIWIIFILSFFLFFFFRQPFFSSFQFFYTVHLLSLPFVPHCPFPCPALHPSFCFSTFPSATASLYPSALSDSLIHLSRPVLFLAAHPHFLQYSRGRDRDTKRARSKNTKRPSAVTTLNELGTPLYNWASETDYVRCLKRHLYFRIFFHFS